MLPMSNQQTKKPKACILLLTLGCSLRCKMCNLWLNDETKIIRPSIEEWKKLIVSLAEFSESGLNVIFGGGEPLLFPDTLIELISFCHKHNLRTSLATSGYLINEEIAERLISAGLDYIALTLYSLNKDTHNFMRGMPDSYDRLMQAVSYLDNLNSKLEIAVDTVIMAPNLKEIIRLAEWVRQDRRLRSIFFQAVVQPFHSRPLEDWYKNQEYNFLWPKEIKEADSVIDELIGLKENIPCGQRDKINNPVSQLRLFKSYFRNPDSFVKKFNCNVINSDAFTVSPDGSINLCPYMSGIGNIREADIMQILHSPEANLRRQEISFCKRNCHHIINCWYEEEGPEIK